MKNIEEISKKILESLRQYGFVDSTLSAELSQFLPRHVSGISDFIRRNGDTDLFLKAIDVLVEAGGQELLSYLTELASDADSQVRSRAIAAIGNLSSTESVPVLALFLKDSDRRIRANAVEALAKIRDDCIVPLLLPLLEDDDNRVQANTAMALWQFHDQQDRVRSTFEKMLVDGRKWQKASAYYAFGEIGLQEFLYEIMGALDDPDEDLARNAVLALIGYAEHIDPQT